jgi:hypothetical protein
MWRLSINIKDRSAMAEVAGFRSLFCVRMFGGGRAAILHSSCYGCARYNKTLPQAFKKWCHHNFYYVKIAWGIFWLSAAGAALYFFIVSYF